MTDTQREQERERETETETETEAEGQRQRGGRRDQTRKAVPGSPVTSTDRPVHPHGITRIATGLHPLRSTRSNKAPAVRTEIDGH